MKYLNDEICGTKVNLSRLSYTVDNTQMFFDVVKKNTGHLLPWVSWFSPEVFKLEDCANFLQAMDNERDCGRGALYSITVNKEFAGSIQLSNLDTVRGKAEIGYWLDAGFVRNGYVLESVLLLEQELFSKFLPLNKIQMICDMDNVRALRVAKMAGYTSNGIITSGKLCPIRRRFAYLNLLVKLRSDWQREKK